MNTQLLYQENILDRQVQNLCFSTLIEKIENFCASADPVHGIYTYTAIKVTTNSYSRFFENNCPLVNLKFGLGRDQTDRINDEQCLRRINLI